AIGQWSMKNEDYLADLLVAMGQCLGYRLDRVYIKKGIYAPEGHSRDQAELHAIRQLVIRLLTGEGAISTRTALVPGDEQAKVYGTRLQTALLAVVEGQQAIAVKPPAQPEPLVIPNKTSPHG